jgi:hypothetical protein
MFTFQEKEQIAQTDIECWKVVHFTTNVFGRKIAVTPIQKRRISRRILSGKSYFRARGYKEVYFYDKRSGEKVIKRGFIHVFSNIEDAQKFITWSCLSMLNDQIRKCVIPKGTKYYKSSDKWSEYAARKIKFV